MTAGIGSDFETVDISAAPRAKIDCATRRVIPIERGRRTSNDIDSSIGMWIDKIRAREAVGLRHRKSVVELDDVFDAIAILGIRPAD